MPVDISCLMSENLQLILSSIPTTFWLVVTVLVAILTAFFPILTFPIICLLLVVLDFNSLSTLRKEALCNPRSVGPPATFQRLL